MKERWTYYYFLCYFRTSYKIIKKIFHRQLLLEYVSDYFCFQCTFKEFMFLHIPILQFKRFFYLEY